MVYYFGKMVWFFYQPFLEKLLEQCIRVHWQFCFSFCLYRGFCWCWRSGVQFREGVVESTDPGTQIHLFIFSAIGSYMCQIHFEKRWLPTTWSVIYAGVRPLLALESGVGLVCPFILISHHMRYVDFRQNDIDFDLYFPMFCKRVFSLFISNLLSKLTVVYIFFYIDAVSCTFYNLLPSANI